MLSLGIIDVEQAAGNSHTEIFRIRYCRIQDLNRSIGGYEGESGGSMSRGGGELLVGLAGCGTGIRTRAGGGDDWVYVGDPQIHCVTPLKEAEYFRRVK